jgi:hypothetical protein
MKRTRPSQLPRQRTYDLVVHDLPDEVLVYDRRSDRAHCLNHTAALVWRACDGTRAPQEIAGKLTIELDAPVSEDLVLIALAQLDKFHLLEPSRLYSLPQPAISRREMVRTLAVAGAVALPVITSIVAPTPAQAGSCKHANATCSTGADCCSGVCSPGAPPKCLGG